MTSKVLFFETHPIQYRAPIFQALAKRCPDNFEVVYASDFSVRGYKDAGFGANVAWDVPLLSGYPNRVLNNDRPGGIDARNGLGSTGVDRLIRTEKPKAIVLSSLGYNFCTSAYLAALRHRVPIWIRFETQDHAFARGSFKHLLRWIVYRAVYLAVSKAFYIGELSRQHLKRHGVNDARLFPARYCTADRVRELSEDAKAAARDRVRTRWGIAKGQTVVAFFGKLIPKKDPTIILRAMLEMNAADAGRFECVFVGSGELEPPLQELAAKVRTEVGVKTHFAGFVNQSQIRDYYLAADIVCLPSRQAGETWGLVANEALQAGCAVVVSNAVGCHADFDRLARFRTVPVGDAVALAKAFVELAALERSFDWAVRDLADYSVEASADALCSEILKP